MNSSPHRRLILLLPVYNEGQSIYNLLQRLSKLHLAPGWQRHVIVIDDCSTDDSAQWIKKAVNAFSNFTPHLITHPQNKGLPGALNTALDKLDDIRKEIIHDDDIIVTMDGDDTHPVPLIPDMIYKIDQGADIVIASRYCEQSRIAGLSTWRRFLSLGARFVYTMRWRTPGVRDYTCQFRAVRARLYHTFLDAEHSPRLKQKGFACVTELLLELSKNASVIVEVPFFLRYERKINRSSNKVFVTIFQTLSMTLRRFSR